MDYHDGDRREGARTHRLHLSIGLQTFLSQLPAVPRGLVATERRLGPKHVIAVNPTIWNKISEVTLGGYVSYTPSNLLYCFKILSRKNSWEEPYETSWGAESKPRETNLSVILVLPHVVTGGRQ